MPLPPPETRDPIHTRQIVFRCYRRRDGLWDLEGYLCDVKDYTHIVFENGPLPAGKPMHDMAIRLTIDDALTIRDIAFDYASAPFSICPRAGEPMRSLIGENLGRGWQKVVAHKIGGVKGCTHMRQILVNAGPAAFQSVWSFLESERRARGEMIAPKTLPRPPYIDTCMSWAADGPITERYQPNFYVGEPSRQTREKS